MPVVDLELTGFYMNKTGGWNNWRSWKSARAELANDLQEMLGEGVAQASLFGPARANINLDSQQQVTEALNRLGIPLPDSTRNWKLQPLAAQYPVVAKLLEYRTMQKALTSYGQNMIEFINPKTGRLHADFRQIGAPTGRFACTNPNIQQVPHAVEYRRCFTGYPDGRKLVIADYSQIELRILAEFSGDEAFIEAFRSGADLASRYRGASVRRPAGSGNRRSAFLCQALELWRGVRNRRAALFHDDGIERDRSRRCFAPLLFDLPKAGYLLARIGQSRRERKAGPHSIRTTGSFQFRSVRSPAGFHDAA